MPKFLQNYRIEPIEPKQPDQMDYFKGIQNGSNKNFILKRFKMSEHNNSDQCQQKDSNCSANQFFQKLTNETTIIRKFQNPYIPKCLRMLKTSNSIYFVFEEYPLTSLQQYLHKKLLKFQQKTILSIKILEMLLQVHNKKVAYNGLILNNIKIDNKGNVYLTNFKESVCFQSNQKFQNEMVLKSQMERMFLEDIFNAAKICFVIFQFEKINSDLCVFLNDKEKKIYQFLSKIIQRKIQKETLEKLLKVLNEKDSFRETECTTTPDSPRSPCTVTERRFAGKISKNSVSQSVSQKLQTSISSKKHNILNLNLSRTPTLGAVKNGGPSSSNQLLAPFHHTLNPSKSASQMSILLSSRRKTSSQNSENIFSNITLKRKLLNFMLYCQKFLIQNEDLRLLILLLAKTQEINYKLTDFNASLAYQNLRHDEYQFYETVKKQSIKTKILIIETKKMLKKIVEENSIQMQILDYFQKQTKSFSIEDKISEEIYKYLKKQIQMLFKCEFEPNTDLKSTKQTMDSQKNDQTTIMMKIKNKLFQLSQQSKKDALDPLIDYEKIKFYYYLSIKLKYGTFEKFIEKKNFNSKKYNIFKDEYFSPFQAHNVPKDQLFEEIVFRMQKFIKKASINNNH